MMAKYMPRRIGKETLLPLLSGALTAAALPATGWFPLVFVSLIPWYISLEPGRGFRSGWFFGIAFFAVDLRWILALDRFNVLVIPGWFLLIVVFGLSFGLLGWIAVKLTPRNLILRSLVLLPALFVLAEYARMFGPLGMGFSTLYLSAYRIPWLIQSAAIAGPWLLTAGFVAINGAIYLAMRRRSLRALGLAAAILGLLSAFALLPLSGEEGASQRIAVIASQVLQEEKLDARNLDTLQARYLTLGEEALVSDPDLIVFPESILPSYILQDSRVLPDFQALARRGSVEILLGTGVYRDDGIYNTVAHLSAEGGILETYEMVRPVPFGEYIPGRSLLELLGLGEWLDSFLPLDLSRGSEYRLLGTVGTPICFESTFPIASRRFAQQGAVLLATVTNDAWFAGNSELISHFAATLFRAVETRRWMVQAANGGVSGIISPRGEIVASQRREGVLVGEIEPRQGRSIYVQFGDLPMLLLAACCVLGLLVRRLRYPVKGSGGRIY